MMISEKMQGALNGQIQAELESGYLYLAMGAWFDGNDMPGSAHWMKKQAEEEREHAMKLYAFINARGGRVVLKAIPAPREKWENATEVFEETLAHEQAVTAMIYKLAEAAEKEKDLAAREMLNWFIKEQVEEEQQSMDILVKFRKLGENPISLAMLDRELGARA